MPRLHGIAEKLQASVYDAIRFSQESDKRALMAGRIRLMGTANVGSAVWTNRQPAEPLAMANDNTFYVINWYATTSIPSTVQAFTQWSHSARATFVIGNKPTWSKSVAELLARPQWAPEHKVCHHCRATMEQSLSTSPDPYAERKEDHRNGVVGLIVPPRQCYDVVVTSDRRATSQLLETLHGQPISPEPAVWIHLEGTLTRDVC